MWTVEKDRNGIPARFQTGPESYDKEYEITQLAYKDIKLVGNRFACPKCGSLRIQRKSTRKNKGFVCRIIKCRDEFPYPLDRTKPTKHNSILRIKEVMPNKNKRVQIRKERDKILAKISKLKLEEDLSTREIAERLGMTKGKIKNLLSISGLSGPKWRDTARDIINRVEKGV